MYIWQIFCLNVVSIQKIIRKGSTQNSVYQATHCIQCFTNRVVKLLQSCVCMNLNFIIRCSLHLNSQRNRIIKLSLIMEMLAVTAGSGAVIGSIFGMNLLSGIENHPSAFYWVTGGTTLIMSSILIGLFLRFRHLVVAR